MNLIKWLICFAIFFLLQKLGPALSEDGCLAEFASVASVHPSPVSVLEYPMYKDDALSPVKQMPDVLKGSALLY